MQKTAQHECLLYDRPPSSYWISVIGKAARKQWASPYSVNSLVLNVTSASHTDAVSAKELMKE